MNNQKQLGKYYTINNPFDLKAFRDWFNSIPDISNLTILEPFAGSNNIVNLMGVSNKWECFDLLPTTNLAPQFQIIKRDTIKNFPTGFEVAITNPPYLAKNSATRNSLVYQGDPYDDLYKSVLRLCFLMYLMWLLLFQRVSLQPGYFRKDLMLLYL